MTKLPMIFFALSLSTFAFSQDENEERTTISTQHVEFKDAEITGHTPIPPALIDANIDVKLKNGDTQHYSANEYKVVPRSSSRRVQQLINTLRTEIKKCKSDLNACQDALEKLEDEIKGKDEEIAQLKTAPLPAAPAPTVVDDSKANTVSILFGYGQDGLETKTFEGGTKVQSKDAAPLFGLGYTRNVFDNYSLQAIGLHGMSSKSKGFTGLAAGGYRF